jgi:formate hydrogenlyase subunit 6/NADH:ubiquinone oxidoreductase subunit I
MAYGLGVAKGMLTTISHLIKPPVTIQYPEERLDMPIWTRGRPRLIYEVDTGDLRCTACGACALACPVDVIKIEQHPSPIKGKVLDRFDIDMAGCIECALCVEACPFRAITMAPDFEMASTYDRTTDLVFDMYDLRIPGTAEIDAGMEHIQGVKRGLRGQAAPAAAAGAAAARPAPARAAPAAAPAPAAAAAPTPTAPAAGESAAAPAGATPAAAAPPAAAVAAPAAVADVPADYDPLTISDEDLKKLPAAERAKVYRARLRASGWQPPAPR